MKPFGILHSSIELYIFMVKKTMDYLVDINIFRKNRLNCK